MEKFTVYQYDDEFYSEEYLKKKGFQFYYYADYCALIKDKGKDYSITLRNPYDEEKYHVKDGRIDCMKFLGLPFMDNGETGLVVDAKIYYAIAHNEATCIFESQEERDAEYCQLEALLEEKIRELVDGLVSREATILGDEFPEYEPMICESAEEEERSLQNNFQKQYILSRKNKLKRWKMF